MTSEWLPIESAPRDGRRFLGYVPIRQHRLVICFYSREGLLLNERAEPMPWPATMWHPLPDRPE